MKEVEAEKEEKLREAACFGDAHAVRLLLKAGVVDVNSQHRMNKWTALHWAAKRNNPELVKILLENGAEKLVENDKGQIALQLTTSDDVRILLGGTVEERPKQVVGKSETSWSSLSEESNKSKSGLSPFVPSYMLDLNRRVDLSAVLPEPEPDPSVEHSDKSAVQLSNRSNAPAAASDKSPKTIFVRIGKPGFDEDYVSIYLITDRLSLRHLVAVVCREFETSAADVVKIRRRVDEGRNVVVRNDADVEELPNGAFVEVVVRESACPVFPELRVPF